MNRTILPAVVLAQLAFGVATLAAAEEALGPNQVAVSYGDLNLQTPAGQQTLERRMTTAARSVCPDRFSRDLDTRTEGKRCIRQAVDQAMGVVSERQLARASAVKADHG